MKLKKNNDGTYSLLNLTERQLRHMVQDGECAKFAHSASVTHEEIAKLVCRELKTTVKKITTDEYEY